MMKRVSFEVAKALKEVGYPQGETDNTRLPKYYGVNGKFVKLPLSGEQMVYFAPTYLDVWLWLWRDKHYTIECIEKHGCFHNNQTSYGYQDPEENIIAAIEYLVDNNLIK